MGIYFLVSSWGEDGLVYSQADFLINSRKKMY